MNDWKSIVAQQEEFIKQKFPDQPLYMGDPPVTIGGNVAIDTGRPQGIHLTEPITGDIKWSPGTKHDQDKPRMDLLDADALEGLAKVLTFGAKKYAAHNWRGGIAYSRIVSSLLRHLSAIQRGEYFDPESGHPHIDHVGCNWMFLSYFMKHRPDLDDLWKPDENSKSRIG